MTSVQAWNYIGDNKYMMDFKTFEEFWKNGGIIVFDANVLLNLYNFPIESTKEIIAALSKIHDRIWIPAQVLFEFEGNKKRVSEKSFGKYEKIKKDVEKLLDNTITNLYDTLGKCNKFKYPQFTEIIKYTISSIKENRDDLSQVDSEIEVEKRLNKELLGNDIVQKFVSDIQINKQIGDPFNHIELIQIYVEWDTRYRLGIPPGFKDKKKLNEETDYINRRKAYGDLIIWKEILRKSIISQKDILLVTDDEKVDWWKFELINDNNTGRETKRIIGAHDELIEEFKILSSKNFDMLTFSDFIEYLTSLRIINSVKLYYELNKLNILNDYVIDKLDVNDINVDYIIKDLDSHFSYEATKYEVSIKDIIFEDKEEVFLEFNDEIVSITGRFILELIVDGTIKNDESNTVKSVLFDFECECSVDIELERSIYIKRHIINGDIRILKAVNNNVVGVISDDIDLYDIYDLKIRLENALNEDDEEELTEYDYKLLERFGHVQFYSLDKYNELEDIG